MDKYMLWSIISPFFTSSTCGVWFLHSLQVEAQNVDWCWNLSTISLVSAIFFFLSPAAKYAHLKWTLFNSGCLKGMAITMMTKYWSTFQPKKHDTKTVSCYFSNLQVDKQTPNNKCWMIQQFTDLRSNSLSLSLSLTPPPTLSLTQMCVHTLIHSLTPHVCAHTHTHTCAHIYTHPHTFSHA